MTDARRNYPDEKAALQPISESILSEWDGNAGAMQRAAAELRFSRFWLGKMDGDVQAGRDLVGRALLQQAKLMGLINHVRAILAESEWGESMEAETLLDQIDAAIGAPALPQERESP